MPRNSSTINATIARTLADDKHTAQLAPSRGMPSGGLSHSVPQTLQRNFPESENVKRSPPVPIVKDLDRNLFIARARRGVF